METQHTIGWLSLDFPTGWWQIFRVRVPGKHQPVLGYCRSPVHTVHRWGDYTGRWRPLEIRNDTKPNNSERPVDALAVKTVNHSLTDNLKSRDASASKNTKGKDTKKKYKIFYWPPRDTPPANSAVCTSQGTSHMCPLPPLTTTSFDSIYFYVKIYFPLSDIFPSSIFYIERYFLLDSFIGLYKQTNWASISESSNWKLNAWKMVFICHLFFLLIIIIKIAFYINYR